MDELKKIWHDEIVPKWRAETWRGRISWVANGILFLVILPFYVIHAVIFKKVWGEKNV